MTAPTEADALRGALQLISQVGASSRTGPEAAYKSIIARMETIASIALTRAAGACVVNLARGATDLGLIRSALRAYRINGEGISPYALGVDQAETDAIDRLVAAIDHAQAAIAKGHQTKVRASFLDDVGIEADHAKATEDDFG